jgi:hypothetical protein
MKNAGKGCVEIPVRETVNKRVYEKMKKETAVRENAGIDVLKDDFRVAFMIMTAAMRTAVCGTHTLLDLWLS